MSFSRMKGTTKPLVVPFFNDLFLRIPATELDGVVMDKEVTR